MPGRNIRKVDVANSYYHVYARGVNKQVLFRDERDFVFFISILERYLSDFGATRRHGPDYPKYYDDIQLLSYCLMPNHFHLLVLQINEKAMTKLLHAVMTSYASYFNKRYKRSGPLFESRYRASHITSDGYLLHISRYIHLNPHEWRHYRYSSLQSYVDAKPPKWLSTGPISNLFTSAGEYLTFHKDYEQRKGELEYIKHELANND